MWDLVGNPKDRFSHNEAHMINVFSLSLNGHAFNIIASDTKMSLKEPITAFKIENEV